MYFKNILTTKRERLNNRVKVKHFFKSGITSTTMNMQDCDLPIFILSFTKHSRQVYTIVFISHICYILVHTLVSGVCYFIDVINIKLAGSQTSFIIINICITEIVVINRRMACHVSPKRFYVLLRGMCTTG